MEEVTSYKKELARKLQETPACTFHQRCTCRYALVTLGMELKKEVQQEERQKHE